MVLDSNDLWIPYLASTEVQKNPKVVRYVLSEKLTEDDKKQFAEYDNVEVNIDGATNKDTGDKYDTLFITEDYKGGGEDLMANKKSKEDEEIDETFEEDIDPGEDQDLDSDQDLEEDYEGDEDYSEDEVLSQLDEDLDAGYSDEGRVVSKAEMFSMVSSMIQQITGLIYSYDSMMRELPQYAEIFKDQKEDSMRHLGQLQAILNQDPQVGEPFTDGYEEGLSQIEGDPLVDAMKSTHSTEGANESLEDGENETFGGFDSEREGALKQKIYQAIKSSPVMSDEDKECFIEEVAENDMAECMFGVERGDPMYVYYTSSKENMEFAADCYVKVFEAMVKFGDESDEYSQAVKDYVDTLDNYYLREN